VPCLLEQVRVGALARKLPLDTDETPLEIDVVPGEAERLRNPQSGEEEQRDQRAAGVRGRSVKAELATGRR
jgi:hypothetical protein